MTQTKERIANVGSIRGYAARYANFKAVIDAHVAVVEKEFEAAKGIADAEQQTEAMQAANAHLDELLGHFEAFDRDSKKIGTLSRDPDLLTLHLPVGGVVETQLALGHSVVFAGFELFHQVVAIELDPQAAIVAMTGSNGLRLVKGWF